MGLSSDAYSLENFNNQAAPQAPPPTCAPGGACDRVHFNAIVSDQELAGKLLVLARFAREIFPLAAHRVSEEPQTHRDLPAGVHEGLRRRRRDALNHVQLQRRAHPAHLSSSSLRAQSCGALSFCCA